MFPTNPSRYPEFVADQILTAQNLTDLFNYLDEQERLTRTNLIGVGIVCGLDVRVSPAGDAITITKGVGVTTSGYLVSIPTTTYAFYSAYDPVQEKMYEPVLVTSEKKSRFNGRVFQLAETGTPQAELSLTQSFLSDKVVFLFVELLQKDNKNCDPDSCDDKGITVAVAFKPLLLLRSDAEAIWNEGLLVGQGNAACLTWPEIRMPRYNVPATILPDSTTVLKNFLLVTKEPFVEKLGKALSNVYAGLQLIVADEYPSDPFHDFKQRFAVVFDGSISTQQLIHVQYFYDFFSDLIQAYMELRKRCASIVALCCPNELWFPRHLFLGAITEPSLFRQRFAPSPAVQQCSRGADALRFYFRRLVRMCEEVDIPQQTSGLPLLRDKSPVRITPSSFGDVVLSKKAIPYYYDLLKGDSSLLDTWDQDASLAGTSNNIQSFFTPLYNANDPLVSTPLKYDIEQYNFFRIEGHIGMHWQNAFTQIYQEKYRNRLPFDVIALNADFKTLLSLLQKSFTNLSAVLKEHPEKWKQILCFFNDVEMQYDLQVSELRCTIGKVMRHLYGMATSQEARVNKGTTPVSELLRITDATFKTMSNTQGDEFDDWYPKVKHQDYTPASVMLSSMSFSIAGRGRFASPLALMYYLERIHEALPDGIVELNIKEITRRLRDAYLVAEALLDSIIASGQNAAQGPNHELLLHINAIIRVCKSSVLVELYRNFMYRFYLYISQQSFAMYSFLHSGIEHKAGVTRGGTFILLYHDAEPVRQVLPDSVVDIRETAGFAVVADRTRRSEAITERAAVTAGAVDALRTGSIADRLNIKINLDQPDFIKEEDITRLSSIKNIGLTYLNQIVAAKDLTRADNLTDQELDALVRTIPDGTVIADFFVPYVCASECMPMSFIVLGGDEQTKKLVIRFQPSQFCVTDPAEYTGKGEPAGGTFEGEGVQPVTDGFVFLPSRVQLGSDASKKVTITYKKEAEVTNLEVEVFAAPVAAFDISLGASNAQQFICTNTSKFATSFIWRVDGQVRSTEKDFSVLIVEPGNHLITLEAVGKVCANTVVEKTVEVSRPVVSCSPLADVMTAFNNWTSSDNRNISEFKERFRSWSEVEKLFKVQLPDILPLPVADQLNKLREIVPPRKIHSWLKELHGMIISPDTTSVRFLAMHLYVVLLGLLFFYACNQEKDVDSALISTAAEFESIVAMLTEWRSLQRLTAAQQSKINDLIARIKEEQTRTASTKTVYLALLQKMLDALSSGIR